jgi:hypothetical protein
MIDELIRDGVAATRLSAAQVTAALTASLGLIDKHADRAKAEELYAAVPGASALAAEGARSVGKGKGLLPIPGPLGDAMGMMNLLKKQGVSQADLKALLPVAMSFVQQRTGRDILREVVSTIPGVGPMLGGR